MKYLKDKYYEIRIRFSPWKLKRKVRLYVMAMEKQKRFIA